MFLDTKEEWKGELQTIYDKVSLTVPRSEVCGELKQVINEIDHFEQEISDLLNA